MYGATRSKLKCESYLPSSRIKEYLSYLKENEMLIYNERTMLYKTVEKGIRFLQMHEKMNELFSQKRNPGEPKILNLVS